MDDVASLSSDVDVVNLSIFRNWFRISTLDLEDVRPVLESPAELSRVDGKLQLQGLDLFEDLDVGVVLENVAAFRSFFLTLEAEAFRQL